MENGIEKFDPSTLMQGVKDRIKATFVSLIPDEQWTEMVRSEVNKYFAPGYDGYGNRPSYSDFTRTVHDVLNQVAKDKLNELLAQPEFTVVWKGNNYDISDILRKEIIEKAPDIFATMISNSVATTIQNLRR